MKQCRICLVDKELDNFHKKHNMKDGHRNECKECVKEIKKKYVNKEKRKIYDKNRYDKNREKILKQKKEYRRLNKEKLKIKRKEYILNNREKVKETIKKYYKNHREQILNNRKTKYKHVIIWRSILNRTLKYMNTPKENKTIELLKYSALDLKIYLENHFDENMTWNNYGIYWEIDHILPISKFNKNTPVDIINSLENLKPMTISENRTKRVKIDKTLEIYSKYKNYLKI